MTTDKTGETVETVAAALAKAEADLASARALLRATMESTGDGILIVDNAGLILSYNRTFAEMWRIPETVLASRDDDTAIAWVLDQLRDPEAFVARVRDLYAHPSASGEDVLFLKDGRVFERYSQAQFVDGQPAGRVWSFRDATEHRLAEAALRESERRSRALIENSSEGIVTASPDGLVLWASPSTLSLLGHQLDDVRGRNLAEFIHPDDLPLVTELFGRVLSEPHERPQGHTRTRHAAGHWLTIEATFTNLMKEPGLHAIVLHVRDVTESLALQEQLVQAQKMDAIGRLAGGVAHDFNNMLTAIVGHAELLKAQLSEGTAAFEDVVEIEKAAVRAAGLTQQLLAFSRRQVLQLTVLDLDAVFEGMQRMLRRLIGEDVQLTFEAGGPAWIKADASQMEQVMLNLVVNARDAMPTGGVVRIESSTREIGDIAADQLSIAPGPYVVLTVADNGHGMDAATRARIFEPFFTTRKEGTGLGLSTVYGVIRQSGGLIAAQSQPGAGTTFTVHLPRVAAPAASDMAAPAAAAADGTETILLVEDEDSVRDLVAAILRQHGYRVIEAANGTAALAVERACAGPIDLLLTDVVMPDFSGPEVARRVLERRPSIGVLFMSGYTDDAVLRHGVLKQETSFLQKPFTPIVLAAKVREVLDQTTTDKGRQKQTTTD
jgi:PAS domain S-box-containing protein